MTRIPSRSGIPARQHEAKMKKTLLILFITIFYSCNSVFAAGAPTKATTQPQSQNVQTVQPAPPPAVDFSNCNKYFKLNSQALFYLTLSSINANHFNIDEIQSRSGYILFSTGQRQFLASIITINPKNSMLKVTPCNNNYYFSVGIVQNMFKYIELNLNTPIEKLNVS